MLKYLDILQFKLLVLVFGGAVLWVYLRRIDIRDRLRVICERLSAHEKTFLIVLLIAAFFLQAFIAEGVLLKFPNSGDEYAYFLQAKVFSSGRLWSDPHPEAPFFQVCHIAQLEGKRVSRYPPGWPLFLASGMALKIPSYFINPLIGTLGLWFFYLLGRRLYGKPAAVLSSLSLLFSSFFLFNGGSYFSHSSCLLMILLSIYFLDRYQAQPNRWFAIGAGFAMGYAFIIRYYTALLISAAVGWYWIWNRLWKLVPYLILGFLPPFLFLFFYNNQITGDPFHLVARWMDPAEKLGFVKGHTLLRAMDHILAHHYDFIKWTSPALLFLYAYFLIANFSRKEKYGIRYIFIALVIGHILFYSLGGNRYGPRYYYEGYPFMLLFVAGSIINSTEKRNRRLQSGLTLFFISGFLVGMIMIPFFMYQENQVVQERLDLYRLVEKEQLTHSIVFLSVGTGVQRYLPPGDLTRNGLDFSGEVLYVWDLGEKNQRLMDYYPDRQCYRYVREMDRVEGRLERLR